MAGIHAFPAELIVEIVHPYVATGTGDGKNRDAGIDGPDTKLPYVRFRSAFVIIRARA